MLAVVGHMLQKERARYAVHVTNLTNALMDVRAVRGIFAGGYRTRDVGN